MSKPASAQTNWLAQRMAMPGVEGERAREAFAQVIGMLAERFVADALAAAYEPPADLEVQKPAAEKLSPLVNISELAALFGVSRKHAANRIVTRPDFPAPVVRLSQRTRKWSREDVTSYLKKRSRAGR